MKVFCLRIFSFFLLFAFQINSAYAQTCDSSPSMCSGETLAGLSTEFGLPTPLPADYCFQTENAVYYEFQTKNTMDYPEVDFSSTNAIISISNIDCLQDSLYDTGLNLAVFSADDPCDEATYSSAIACETNLNSDIEVYLINLEPNKTYYIVVSGVLNDTSLVNPAQCSFDLTISGPAVTYDLGLTADPVLLFQGQETTLSANAFNDFEYEWQGEALSENTGNPVTANPDVIGQSYTYTADITIDDCPYSGEVKVMVAPAISPYNTFTPNGDGVNDFWEIEGILQEANENSQISVYSRWGQKVFQTTGYNNDWDGDGLPAATYYYVIELNPLEFDAEPITGSVTIIY